MHSVRKFVLRADKKLLDEIEELAWDHRKSINQEIVDILKREILGRLGSATPILPRKDGE